MKKISFIKVCLVISLFLNLVGLGLGLTYVHYVNLSIPYAISRMPNIVRDVLGIKLGEDIALKQIIIQEYPELETGDITDYEKVCILRDWAAKVIDVSSYSLQLTLRDQSFGSWSAYDIYSAFAGDQGGVVCGGSATFLTKVYHLFDLQACTLNFGIHGLHTHMVTLVQIEHNGQEILSVQDAWYNLTYQDLNSEPMDYFTMLGLLMQQKDDEIAVIKSDTSLERDWLYYDGDIFWPEQEDCTYVGPVISGTEITGVTKYRCTFTMPTSLSEEGEEFLTQRGLPPRRIYLYVFPRNISYCSRAAELLEKASQITGWPLPVVPLSVK